VQQTSGLGVGTSHAWPACLLSTVRSPSFSSQAILRLQLAVPTLVMGCSVLPSHIFSRFTYVLRSTFSCPKTQKPKTHTCRVYQGYVSLGECDDWLPCLNRPLKLEGRTEYVPYASGGLAAGEAEPLAASSYI
jgi:hypothetical protein